MTKDTRTYITVHDGMPENGKIRPLSDKAFRTLVEVWCWCSRERNDGEISVAAFKTFGTPRARQELVDAGLIEDRADGVVAAHDYLSHQRSRAQIEELSATRSKVGKLGGRPPKAKQDETNLVSEPEAKKTHSHSQIQKTEDDEVTSHPETGYEELSPSRDDPGDNSLFRKIIAACATRGVDIHPLVVPDILAFIDARRGPKAKPIQAPERYYPGVVRDEWPVVSQFIHEKGLAS